jgi:hypothetical protein
MCRKRAHRRTCPRLEKCNCGPLKCRVRAKHADYNSPIPFRSNAGLASNKCKFNCNSRRQQRYKNLEHHPAEITISASQVPRYSSNPGFNSGADSIPAPATWIFTRVTTLGLTNLDAFCSPRHQLASAAMTQVPAPAFLSCRCSSQSVPMPA